MNRIPVAGPWITQREIDYVTDAVTRCWYGQAGEYHERFERAFAEYLGVPHAVCLPSCTSAIHLALAALGLGPGDEVLVPDATWIASAAPIRYVGAQPVFCDISAEDWCLSPAVLDGLITPRTQAIIVVDLYGNMPQWSAIRAVAASRGIPLIEDAAEAFGSEYQGRKAGVLGDVGVFSFHGSKTMTTGEGGMLVTGREDLYRRVLFLRDHGRQPGDVNFFNHEVAFKYKMSSMQAALGLAQVERADELVDRKREIFRWYAEELAEEEHVTLNPEPPDVRNSCWMATAVVAPALGLNKQQLIAWMSQRGVDCRPFFHPLSSLPAYAADPQAAAARGRNTTAYRICAHGINLPSSLALTRPQAAYAAECLRQAVRRAVAGWPRAEAA